ncbi:bifunctional phosphoglucose/phosphomannose isomerase [Candidatus Bipolaricaulota bacterium]|nr:bifunctional phosphoglucose/phosphomannose isomerase [Candidatus Bipolaricaulota bacterium]
MGERGVTWTEFRAQDRSGMAEVLAGFPTQCRAGLALAERVPLDGLAGFSRVVALGMGGSGIAGGLLGSLLTVEVASVRDYTLPPWMGEESLIVALSYSGDTEETLAAFAQARRRTKRLLAVTSGGKLGRLCAREGIPWVEIPKGYQPRAALGYLLFPLLGLFRRLDLVPDLGEALAVLDGLAAELAPGETENEAQKLARRLAGRVPLVYGAGPTAPVAFRWKTQLNENAKQPAFSAELPELCHNEVVGWELTGRLLPQGTVIFLRSAHDHPRVGKRVEILQELLEARGIPWLDVPGRGEGSAAQLLSLLYRGDWVSYYLALLNGVDPTPVPIIQELKGRLA